MELYRNYKNLAEAIVYRAVIDYIDALRFIRDRRQKFDLPKTLKEWTAIVDAEDDKVYKSKATGQKKWNAEYRLELIKNGKSAYKFLMGDYCIELTDYSGEQLCKAAFKAVKDRRQINL